MHCQLHGIPRQLRTCLSVHRNGSVFDFFDGMSARLLHVSSPLGKELDSLADDVPRCSSFGHGIFSIPRGGLSGISDAGSRVYAVHGFSHFRIFSPPSGKIQYRPATKYVVYRTPDTGQYAVLGFADCRCTRFLVSDSFNALWLLVMVIVMSLY